MAHRRARVVYFCPRPEGLASLGQELIDGGHRVVRTLEGLDVEDGGLNLGLVLERTPEGVRERLEREYASMVLMDLRPGSDGALFEFRSRAALRVLELLDHAEDVEARYGFHRIAVLVSDEDGADVDDFLLNLGARGIRMVLRQGCHGRKDPRFAARALARSCEAIRGRRVGQTALCLSGGGITGIYFELGVLKCLQDVLPANALSELDMYFGISAGAVVASTLAVGYSVDEFMAALVGHPDTRMPALNLRLMRLAHFNHADLRRRLVRALGSGVGSFMRVLRGREHVSVEDLFLDYSDMLGPLFHSDTFEGILRKLLEVPGATNDFRDLQQLLLVGASDQDARQHVLFGDEDRRMVPISKAVQASLSFNPAFSAVQIDGRYYEDGAVTRTSNFTEAIHRGATLVLVVDPFVPYVSRAPGGHKDRGLFYHMDQSVRTISFTRFENARNWVLRRYPEVSTYTFLPSNRQRRLLSINPMDHRPYLEIWRGAYLSTLQRLERMAHRMRGDLVAHHLSLSMERAQAVAAQLEATEHPTLEDFYPDRRVVVPKPALVRHRPRLRMAG
ncbi:MAG: patatin-like phospholipase family protein [Myxococcales bacterium]|nr:patatin-like phospholipase family protein [Myxococcales bacterium]